VADTRQVVFWSLEQTCPFRRGDGWEKPTATGKAVRPLHLISTRPSNAISGDICVTAWSYYKGETTPIGFRISEIFARYGGLPVVQRTCGNCPANIWTDANGRMGGCWGIISIDPDDSALQAALVGSILAQSLHQVMARTFLATNPLWYGFWINSPLSVQQCDLLLKILGRVTLLDSDDRRFLLALEAALTHHLPLHVRLAPLGHTDLGFYTIFPHCPRCKAFAGFRWQPKLPFTLQRCKVCGNDFRAAETGSSERDEYDDELSSAKLTQDEIQDIMKINTPPMHPLDRVKEELGKIKEQKSPGKRDLVNRLRNLFGGGE
jgi:hypothetical protein